ncbi:hypothetical protein GCM10009565_52900 [Amycolatopsis albidoflavus]
MIDRKEPRFSNWKPSGRSATREAGPCSVPWYPARSSNGRRRSSRSSLVEQLSATTFGCRSTPWPATASRLTTSRAQPSSSNWTRWYSGSPAAFRPVSTHIEKSPLSASECIATV